MDSNSSFLTFHPQRPCKKEKEHIGRDYIIRQAFSRLSTDDVQSFVIIGSSKTGKTSLINHIRHPNIVKQFIRPEQRAEKYHFLLLDCEKYIDELHSEDDFFRIFHKKIEALLNITHLDSMASLDEITKWLLQHDFRLIVILENFNLVITNPNFNVIFYDGFRSWFSTNISIGCIITSPIELLDLAIPTELSGSPFFNIFSSFKLDPLTLTEAIKLLDSRLPEALKYNRGDIVNLIANIGFNPYELQLSGYLWVRHYEKTKKAEFNLSLVEIYNKLLPHYNEIYSNLKEDQINNIRGIFSGDNNSNSIDRNLISNGWVTSDKKNIVAKQMEKYFRDRLSINCKKNKNTIKIIKLFLFKLLHFK